MINEDYCSYEVAKLLKEKGFDWGCITYYVDSEPNGVKYSMLFENNNTWEDRCCSAPTHQMTIKWLREVHHIAINIGWGEIFEDQYQWWSIVLNMDSGAILCEYDYHISYEQSCEAAIKNCLEKLI